MSNGRQSQQVQPTPKDPIVNCHTHIFTGDYVPPYLARTFLPAPIYKWISVSWLIRKMRKRYADESVDRYFQGRRERKEKAEKSRALADSVRKRIMDRFVQFLVVWLSLNIILVIFDHWFHIIPVGSWLDSFESILSNRLGIQLPLRRILWIFPLYLAPGFVQFVVVGIAFFVIPPLKKWALFILDKMGYDWFIPSEMTKDMIRRYLQLGQYARYRRQQDIMDRLEEQHPPNSQFIILPMDMKYMDAGPVRPSKGALPAEYISDLRRARSNILSAEEVLSNGVNGASHRTQAEINAAKAKIALCQQEIESIESLRSKDYYYLQLDKLRDLKKNRGAVVRPFIFVDPRRIRDTKNSSPSFFQYDASDPTNLVLERCVLGDYLFGEWDTAIGRYNKLQRDDYTGFSGLKIYPALGYYPFDRYLLPLLVYAAQNEIPIMTHCTQGVIFYRGKDIPDRNFHPVFTEFDSDDKLPLPQSKNGAYQVNFTHPLNYLCLLDSRLLAIHLKNVLEEIDDEEEKLKLIAIFKYRIENQEPIVDPVLENLKICFGHYGGSSQWERFYEEDRSRYSKEIFTQPEHGIRFDLANGKALSPKKLEDIWYGTEWYSIISSLMLQYPNVYADISYTLHVTDIFPLLKRTLRHERGEAAEIQRQQDGLPIHPLGERILFGTDFYVVRSNKSDKQLLMETRAQLSEEQFDLIARENPKRYLMTRFDMPETNGQSENSGQEEE